MAKGSNLTKEEKLLLQDFSRSLSKKSSATVHANAAVVSLLPVYLFWRVHMMDFERSITTLFLLAIVTGCCTWLISTACQNVKFVLKHKIAQKKGDAIAKEISKNFANKRDKDDKVLAEKNVVFDYESTHFSIFYINSLFLLSVVVLSSMIFGPFSPNPSTNYAMSLLGSAGLVALLSS